MIGGIRLDDGVDLRDRPPVCSRAECRANAVWNVNWRNPRIHGADRVKVWLACDDHREYLYEYLFNRDFPVLVTRLDDPVQRLSVVTAEDGSVRTGRVQ